MIENTFLHVKGISAEKEKKIWKSGAVSWNDFIKLKDNTPFNHRVKLELLKSQNALHNKDYSYFKQRLPKKERWRFLEYFKNNAAYIDIETTGFKGKNNHITTIALYDGIEVKYYVYGQNLINFKKDIFKYDLIVTYNGDLFDLPYIEKYFNISLKHFHIDLRWIFADLGYKGGLKGIEKSFGISRNELDGVNGYFAVLLWKEYRYNKNKKALETLISYNIEDVINLEYLTFKAFNLMLEKLPLNKKLLKVPEIPEIDLKIDENLINRLKNYVNNN